MKQPHKGVEKYLLRSAFDGIDLLPNDILWRPKEDFSDGVSSQTRSWYEVLQEFITEQVSSRKQPRQNTLDVYGVISVSLI